jgi:chemotaxis protein methyltransferase CheR
MVEVLDKIIETIKISAGADLRSYRREVVKRHIEVCMKRVDLHSENEYLEYLKKEPDEVELLLKSFSINVSSFFRDPILFEHIASEIIPNLLSSRPNNPLRVWSAGCAKGEEPYSIAIIMNEIQEQVDDKISAMIFATDIDKSAIESASQACYTRKDLENLKLGQFDKYFTSKGEKYILDNRIRKMVNFSQEDLLESTRHAPQESIFGEFDLILCRNVLIYFNNEEQQQLLKRFSQALSPGGYLVLGMSESLHGPANEDLKTISKQYKIYYKSGSRS